MNNQEFRLLRADEIDVRVATTNTNGASLLLYKDARCDMNILDETVGSNNWQRKHLRDNANCIVEIWDSEKKQWISKEDTGTESFTEKEKGLASDSFKRACFNWGIGRELYTSPFIWITDFETYDKGGKPQMKDKFHVSHIEYESRTIKSVIIKNQKNQQVFPKVGNNSPKETDKPQGNFNNISSVEEAKKKAAEQLKNVSEKDPPLSEPTYACEICGNPFVNINYQGKNMTAKEVFELSKKNNNGVATCRHCKEKGETK